MKRRVELVPEHVMSGIKNMDETSVLEGVGSIMIPHTLVDVDIGA